MNLAELIRFRKDLHRNPELSLHEHRTQIKILEALENMGAENVKKVGGTGVLVEFKGASPGRSVLLRADHDALPIQELGSPRYKSRVPGVSHMCGHDGHTSIMLGVADYYVNNPISKGRLALLFQPAEENGRGAAKVLNDPQFDFNADMAFALHNLPGIPKHKILSRPGIFTPAVKSVIFKLKGKTSHAAEPENGISPGAALGKVFLLANKLNQPDKNRKDFRVVSTVYANLGEKAYGISAGYAEGHFTIRTWSNSEMEKLQDDFVNGVKEICTEHNLEVEWEWLEEFFANENSEEAFTFIKDAAISQDLEFEEMNSGVKWGEDFGLITQRFSGAMFGIGSGEDCPALHNPDYDFPDDILETGILMFTGIANKALA
jgi:amidohydrolase